MPKSQPFWIDASGGEYTLKKVLARGYRVKIRGFPGLFLHRSLVENTGPKEKRFSHNDWTLSEERSGRAIIYGMENESLKQIMVRARARLRMNGSKLFHERVAHYVRLWKERGK